MTQPINYIYQSNDGAIFRHQNWNDADDNPAGGFFIGPGVALHYQDGTIKHGVQSGAQVGDVIAGAIQRLEFFQAGRYPCEENREALEHLHAALDACNRRHRRRVATGLKGQHAEAEA